MSVGRVVDLAFSFMLLTPQFIASMAPIAPAEYVAELSKLQVRHLSLYGGTCAHTRSSFLLSSRGLSLAV